MRGNVIRGKEYNNQIQTNLKCDARTMTLIQFSSLENERNKSNLIWIFVMIKSHNQFKWP